MNNAGARYPWMTSFDGSEQCESWDIGASELHITADIPFAMQQYLDATGDEDFYLQAMEVYIETARFWHSRCIIHPDGSADLMFCKGPDEYCGITNNNLFTNCMVKFNLDLAIKAALKLKETDPNRYSKLSLSDEEVLAWHSLRDNLKECRNPQTGRYLPDETFSRLEPVDIKTLKTDDGASYHHVCFDRLQRYQVIKQADTLLLMSRLPNKFTPEERLDAWEDFEPCCLHDSTLSFASHALFAAQNGLQEAAEKYFKKALYLDLHEIMNNTGKEGLHLACLGETWSSIFFGFLGANFNGDTPAFSPVLPTGWKALRMNFYLKAIQQEWKRRGLSFVEDDKIRLISVVLHDQFSETDNSLMIGHVGVMLPTSDAVYFVEKVAFQEPYRLLKFKNRTELSDYLMLKYDNSWGQDTAHTFIMDNANLMDGWRILEEPTASNG